MKKRLGAKHIIGIDEVGRGPLAGPVAVGAVLIIAEHRKAVAKIFPVIKDSKKLSPKSRGEWFVKICEAERAGFLISSVQFVSPKHIDKQGIAPSIRKALALALEKVSVLDDGKSDTYVLLDGGLSAPSEYKYQKTIIRGDEKILAIALASIVAKVTRDARMIKLGKKFPLYGFEKHKGYGTRAHYIAIKKHGIMEHHRKSFLRSLDQK